GGGGGRANGGGGGGGGGKGGGGGGGPRPPASTKQGAISCAIRSSATDAPRSSSSAKPASRAEPTSLTSLPLAKSRINVWVYSRPTVASVPSTATRLV